MRKIESSGKCCCRIALSSRADLRSRPNGFSSTTRALRDAIGCGQAADHGREHARRNRQVVQRCAGAAERLAQAREGRGFAIVAIDVAQQRGQLARRPAHRTVPCALIDARARSISCSLSPAGAADADDRRAPAVRGAPAPAAPERSAYRPDRRWRRRKRTHRTDALPWPWLSRCGRGARDVRRNPGAWPRACDWRTRPRRAS